MNINLSRNEALERTWSLLDADPDLGSSQNTYTPLKQTTNRAKTPLQNWLQQAQLSVRPSIFLLFAFCFTAGITCLASVAIAPFLIPVVFLAATAAVNGWVEKRIEHRSTEFCKDYPTLLLATASSIKVGHTPDLALERATKLLPSSSPVRTEVMQLLSALKRGRAKEDAIEEFGRSIRLPELALFRTAYILVSENGGKFAPTLERLARVTKDRLALISSARVSTATMRMTANIILLMTPLILWIVSFRSDDFWNLLLHNDLANSVASFGASVICVGYLALRKMSSFKP